MPNTHGSLEPLQRYNMDLKDLLNKLDLIEGTMKSAKKEPMGPKFTGYWKGKDSKTPGKHMVGGVEEAIGPSGSQVTSLLKSISDFVKETSREKDLEESYREFLAQLEEENLGVNPKRAGREGSRHARGHEPKPRYNYKDKDVEEQVIGATPTPQTSPGVQTPGALPGAKAMPDPSKMTPQQQQAFVKNLDPTAMKKAMAGVMQAKSATGSTAAAPDLLRALDSASQGKTVGGKEMTALKPMMGLMKQVATDPKLAQQLKTLAGQARAAKPIK